MRRAALYAWNRGALVIVSERTGGPVLFDSLDFEVATVDPGELAAFVALHGAERLLVAEVGPDAARLLASTVGPLCSAMGVEVASVPETSRKAHGGAASKLCPKGSCSMATRDAMALALADMGQPTRAAPALGLPWAPSSPALTAALCGPVESISPPPGPRDFRIVQTWQRGADGRAIADIPRVVVTPEASVPSGLRVAGVDPGERWIAVTIGAETGTPGAPLAYVASLLVEIERAEGEQPTDEQLDAAVGKAVDFCELHAVERVAVERAVNVYRAPGKSAEEGAGLAAYLLRGQYVAGMLRGALRAARREGGGPLVPGKVESVSSVKGRNYVRRLAGQGIGKGSPWQPGAHAAFGGTIPAGVGEHVLDAAVAAVWATRPEEVLVPARAPRAPRVPGAPRNRKGASAARDARRAAARVAIGCPCSSSRHTDPRCPIQIAANLKRSAKMAGNCNAQPRRPAPSE